MNKAFTKEDDGSTTPQRLDDLPISPHPNHVTPRGLAQLEARAEALEAEPTLAAESGGQVRGMRDLHNAAMVFRAVGRPGVVLIAEGPKGSAQRLAKAESRKVGRVVGEEVPVHTIVVGKGEGQTQLSQVVKTIRKYPKALSNDEALVVQQRMKALGSRNKPAIPAGMDPTRPPRASRRALRGR